MRTLTLVFFLFFSFIAQANQASLIGTVIFSQTDYTGDKHHEYIVAVDKVITGRVDWSHIQFSVDKVTTNQLIETGRQIVIDKSNERFSILDVLDNSSDAMFTSPTIEHFFYKRIEEVLNKQNQASSFITHGQTIVRVTISKENIELSYKRRYFSTDILVAIDSYTKDVISQLFGSEKPTKPFITAFHIYAREGKVVVNGTLSQGDFRSLEAIVEHKQG